MREKAPKKSPKKAPKKKYREVVYIAEDEAEKIFEIMDRDGESATLNYLLQYDKGSGKTTSYPIVYGGHVYRSGEFFMSWDKAYPHIIVQEILNQVEG